jgi:hypothetical protein
MASYVSLFISLFAKGWRMVEEIRDRRNAAVENTITGGNIRLILIPADFNAVNSRSVENLAKVSIVESSIAKGIASTRKMGIINGAIFISKRKLTPESADIADSFSICWVRNADIKMERLREKLIKSS